MTHWAAAVQAEYTEKGTLRTEYNYALNTENLQRLCGIE